MQKVSFLGAIPLYIIVGLALTFINYIVMGFLAQLGPSDISLGIFIIQASPLLGFIIAIPQTFLLAALQNKQSKAT
jgi:hypothetical protein